MKEEKACEKSVKILEGVEIELTDKHVVIKGPKGSLSRDFSDPRFDRFITITKKDDEIVISSSSSNRKLKAFVGTIAAHIMNMMKGVCSGWRYKMKIFHTHFPITVDVKGDQIFIRNFLGEKGSRVAQIVGSAKITVQKDDLFIEGIDKEALGQTAVNIERACKLSGRDRRIFLDGIYIVGVEPAEG
jgi:large subunit ribosomal protein L6